MLMSYMKQSCYMRTIGLTFVSFCNEVLEHEEIYNWVNEKNSFMIVINQVLVPLCKLC